MKLDKNVHWYRPTVSCILTTSSQVLQGCLNKHGSRLLMPYSNNNMYDGSNDGMHNGSMRNGSIHVDSIHDYSNRNGILYA